MSDFFLADVYPGDAVYGADFFSQAAQRDVLDVDPFTGELVTRRERILVSERFFDDANEIILGRPCVSETTVRFLGSLVGLYDEVAMRTFKRRAHTAEAEVQQLRVENRDLKLTMEKLGNTKLVRRIYVAPDGSEHGSPAVLKGYLSSPAPDAPATVQPLEAANE